MMVFINRTVDQSNKQINKTLGFLGAGRVGVLRPPGQEPACTLPPVPRTAHTPVQTRVLPCPGFAVRCGQWLLLTAASPGALACRPFFPRLPSVPRALCFRGWPFSARHHRLVAAVTQSSEDVLVSAGAVQAVPADAAVLDNRKDRTLP